MTLVTSRYCLWLAALAFTAVLAPFRPAFADTQNPIACGTIDTVNITDKWMWVTIYDTDQRTQMDWGWVWPHSDRSWTGGGGPRGSTYICDSAYYVRAEVRANSSATASDISDTTVKVVPTTTGNDRACLTTKDDKSFAWNFADNCAAGAAYIRPPPTKSPLPPGASFPPTQASTSSCHTIFTYNATNNWIWVTIYDPLKIMHMDWGWVGPNAYRRWTAGGAPMNFQYQCALPYYVRGEVKAGGPADTPNIFDTTGKVTAGYTDNLACLMPSGHQFYWDHSKWDATHSCMGNPQLFTGTASNAVHTPAPVTAVRTTELNPTPYPQTSAIKLAVGNVKPPYGPGSTTYRVDIAVDNHAESTSLGASGAWSTTTPEIIQLTDKAGSFRVLKPGRGEITWTYAGKTYDATVRAQ